MEGTHVSLFQLILALALALSILVFFLTNDGSVLKKWAIATFFVSLFALAAIVIGTNAGIAPPVP